MYHFQTFVVGSFPFRLHGAPRPLGHAPARRPHDHRRRRAARTPSEHGLPYFRGGIVEHGGGGHPILEAMYTAARARAHARDARLADARPHVGVHDAGRGPAAGDQPHRPRPARPRRATASRPAGSPTTCIRTRSSRRAYYAPMLEAIMRDAGAECDVRRPPRRRSTATAPASRERVDLAAHHGHVPHGRRPARRASSTAWQRFHDVENMLCTDSSVFPTSHRLRPDAHDRGAGDPRLPRPRRASTAAKRSALPAALPLFAGTFGGLVAVVIWE